MCGINTTIECLAELIGINGKHRVGRAGLPNQQYGLCCRQIRRQGLNHLGSRALGLHVCRNLDFYTTQVVGERLLQPRRISILRAARSRQLRRAGTDNKDVEFLGGECARNLRQRKTRHGQMGGNTAFGRMLGRILGPSRSRQHQQRQHNEAPLHASPPAKPGLAAGGRGPPPFRSACLYHEINAATPTMIVIPAMLTMTCVSRRLETSVNTKWPAKERKTPRQKVSRECWPQTIAGQKIRDFNAGQSRGTSATVIIASERKCMMRRTSRFVLSIGYIASPTNFGTNAAKCGKYQVIAMANANIR